LGLFFSLRQCAQFVSHIFLVHIFVGCFCVEAGQAKPGFNNVFVAARWLGFPA